MKAYQYSILRYRRSKSAGELVNIGLIMVVPEDRKAYRFVSEKYGRLSDFFGEFDGGAFRRMVREVLARIDGSITTFEKEKQITFSHLTAFTLAAKPNIKFIRANTVAGPESCFQWSSVSGGVHPEPQSRFDELVDEFVLRHQQKKQRKRVDESSIITTVHKAISRESFRDQITKKVLHGKHSAEHEFPLSWMNGVTHVLDGISFDYTEPSRIESKAHKWCGMLHNLTNGENFRFIGVTAPPQNKGFSRVYDQALKLIDDMEQTRKIVEVDNVPDVTATIANDLATN